jgi:hypothetical protein
MGQLQQKWSEVFKVVSLKMNFMPFLSDYACEDVGKKEPSYTVGGNAN